MMNDGLVVREGEDEDVEKVPSSCVDHLLDQRCLKDEEWGLHARREGFGRGSCGLYLNFQFDNVEENILAL